MNVDGDTETAVFAAIWLAEQGERTTLVSPGDDVGIDTNDMRSSTTTESSPSAHDFVADGWTRPTQSGFWTAVQI